MLQTLTNKCKMAIVPSRTRANNELFEFVKKPELRKQLTQDMDELHACMRHNLRKPSLVLIGSLIECVLYHHIESVDAIKNSIKRFELRDVGLADLLQWSRTHGIIDENLFRLAEPIREYRNLIHPRVQMRTKTALSDNLVQIGYNILLEVIVRVNSHSNALNSQSSEALVSKIVKSCGRSATKADFHVYVPIVKKYGSTRGSLLIKRSLRAARRKRRNGA